jgi:hypothetical protein
MSDRQDAIAAAIVISLLALIWLVLQLWWQAALLIATATAIAWFARRMPAPGPEVTAPATAEAKAPAPAAAAAPTSRRRKRR